MTDIEIARNCKLEDIGSIAKKINLDEADIIRYGNDKAKICFDGINSDKKGKLILVTAINPTPYGEGKTTVSIGLNDGLRYNGKNSIAVLREPSLGPVFGMKGGATGGGYAQVVPMEDINLHFTGDFHAITSANNLICAAIDSHIYFDNKLNIDKDRILFNRCMDMNDRALRNIELSNRYEKFNITAASEIMSIICLSSSFEDLKNRLGNILIGFDINSNPIYTRDLKLEGSLATLLKDSIKPNLVQSLEGNPVIIHGGPFANISTGCNSLIATKLGLKVSDYVVTEAGFGSDLGASKFFDIKCRYGNLKPDCVVIVATIRALKYHGDDDLSKGISNLEAHINNVRNYTNNIVVALNKFGTDSNEDIEYVRSYCNNMNVMFSISDSFSNGGKGSSELANIVIDVCNRDNDFKLLYEDSIGIREKISTICKKCYGACDIVYNDMAINMIEEIERLGYGNYPICIAKTQYSISDNAKLLGYPKDFIMNVRDIKIYCGAKFIVVYMGNIMTMPGLSKNPNYEKIDIDNNYVIEGLF